MHVWLGLGEILRATGLVSRLRGDIVLDIVNGSSVPHFSRRFSVATSVVNGSSPQRVRMPSRTYNYWGPIILGKKRLMNCLWCPLIYETLLLPTRVVVLQATSMLPRCFALASPRTWRRPSGRRRRLLWPNGTPLRCLLSSAWVAYARSARPPRPRLCAACRP